MIEFFAKHPTAANLLMLLFLVIGAASIGSLERETFPDLPADEIRVQVHYPGALPSDVEDAICRRIEDAVDGVEGIEEVRAEALENVGRVTIEVQSGQDPERVLADVQTEIDAIEDFPDSAEKPVVTQLGRQEEVASIAVKSGMPDSQLKHYCEQLKQRLQRLPEISVVTVEGFSQRQLLVEVPAATLMQYGVSADDIATTIGRQSLDLPAGTLESADGGEFVVRFADERRSVPELESLVVVSGSTGAELRLGEIAKLRDTFEDAEEKIVFDGQRAGLLRVTKTRSQDSLDAVDAMRAFLAAENETAPPGTELVLTTDVSSIVRDRLTMLVKNGWQGMVLVLLTLWLFFNFRLAFWVAMSLPVSFFGAFFVMSVLGYSINMLTMVALLLALGLLMDDGIVLAENIAAHFERGKNAMRAAIDGAVEVKNGVISSFLTTVAVFAPLSFIDGDLGLILAVLPVVLITVLVVSLVEAFLILPAHLGHSLKHREGAVPHRFRLAFESLIERFRDRVVGSLVDWLVRWRYLALGCTVGLTLAVVGPVAGGVIKFQAFPSIDGDVMQARVLAPQGTPLPRTEAIVATITDGLAEVASHFDPLQPDGQPLVQHVSTRYNRHVDAFESGPHLATVTVDLLPTSERRGALDEILARWRDAVGPVPDTISLQFTEPAIGPQGRAIEVQIAGEDLDELASASRDVQAWFMRFDGVYDVFDDLRPGKPQFDIALRDGASSLGLSAQTIAAQLRAAFLGRTARDLQVGSEDYEVEVKYDLADRDDWTDLQDFRVTGQGGVQVPLATVAEITPTRGYARVARVDGQRTVTVIGSVDAEVANVTELITRFRSEGEPGILARYPSLEFEYKGEVEKGAQTGASIARGFLIGAVFIFLLLSFQFRSYVEPLIVMIAIPMAMIGVVVGHLVVGLDLSLPSLMGFASLSGVVVNDSILLVEFIKRNRAAGQSVHVAARRASRERFRAVLLTSVTTIAGMSPLMLETSLQAQLLIPLAVSVVFGIMSSTVLVILLLPVTYTILDDLGLVERMNTEAAQEAGVDARPHG